MSQYSDAKKLIFSRRDFLQNSMVAVTGALLHSSLPDSSSTGNSEANDPYEQTTDERGRIINAVEVRSKSTSGLKMTSMSTEATSNIDFRTGGIGSRHIRVRITRAGNVGIGCLDPSAKLEIQAPHSDWLFLRQERDVDGGGGFHVANPWGNSNQPQGDPARNRLEIAYRTAAGQDAWGQLVLHGPTGNLGVSTTEPKEKLDVQGNIRIDNGSGTPGNNRVWTTQKVCNVLDYGAVGDNSEDDSPKIQAAIEEAKLTGGIVYLPAGVYRIDNPLLIYTGIQFIGAGPRMTWLYGNNGSNVVIDTEKATYTPPSTPEEPPSWNLKVTEIVIRDIGIQGNPDPNNRTSTGIVLRGAFVCRIENVSLVYFKTGIHVAGWVNDIIRCRTHDCFTGLDLSWPAGVAESPADMTNATQVIGGHFGGGKLAPPSSDIQSGNWNGSRVTFTTTSSHRLQYGAAVTISNCSNNSFNGEYRDVVIISATSFNAIPDGFEPAGHAISGKVTGRVIGIFINGAQNNLIGCTIEKLRDEKNKEFETAGVYVRNSELWGHLSPTLIDGCYFEHWKHTFVLDRDPFTRVIACQYNFGVSDQDPIKHYGGGSGRNIVSIGNSYASSRGTFIQNWLGGDLGVGTSSPRAKMGIKSGWPFDWMFLEQERDVEGGGGFHIANPWGNSDQGQGDPSRNRLEIAYQPAGAPDALWGQFVLHGPTGRVGIGSTDPEEKLDVRGAIIADSIRLREQQVSEFSEVPDIGTLIWKGDYLYLLTRDGWKGVRIEAIGNP